MPVTKSAKKALRQSRKRQAQNLARKETYKALLKKIEKLARAGKLDEAKASLPLFYKAADKAAKTHVIAKNKAARLKSRAAKLVSKR